MSGRIGRQETEGGAMTVMTSVWISVVAFGMVSGALVLGYLLFARRSDRSELRSS